MKKAMLLIAGVMTALTLTACGTPATSYKPASHWEYNIKLKDGRTLFCVTMNNAYGSGASCDWKASAKEVYVVFGQLGDKVWVEDVFLSEDDARNRVRIETEQGSTVIRNDGTAYTYEKREIL